MIIGIDNPKSLIYNSAGKLNLHSSVEIVAISILALIAFWYTRADILRHIRRSRLKEANITFDAFYICSNRYKELKKLHDV